jgi:phosphatidylinositol-3-phosphatase
MLVSLDAEASALVGWDPGMPDNRAVDSRVMEDRLRAPAYSAVRAVFLVGTILACLLVFSRPAAADFWTGSGPCAPGPLAPTTVKHVVWIVFENKTYESMIGSRDAPNINSLTHECGLATNFFATARPSLPNYIAMTSGSTQGITDNAGPASHPLDVPNIFQQLGSDWRSLQQSMPSNCRKSNSGLYAVRHNPAAYYTNIDCASNDVPLTAPLDLSAKFTFITPDLCAGMHDCSMYTGDIWLGSFLPLVVATPEYQSGSTVVFITFDEGGSSSQHIVTLVISPYTPAGARSSLYYDHYSLLRTTEEMLGLELLGNAATARSMGSAFGLPSPFYVRPKGATPVRTSLVVAFKPCTVPTREHGAPLSAPSCAPHEASGQLTVGTPTNGNTAKSAGSAVLSAIPGNTSTPANEADARLVFQVTDVRRQSDLQDYTGQVLVDQSLRITDKLNGTTGTDAATAQDMRLPVAAPCAGTTDATVGSTCSITTTFNTVVPGAVVEGKRSIWQLGQVEVHDGGADSDVATPADNTLFMNGGVFVP